MAFAIATGQLFSEPDGELRVENTIVHHIFIE